MTALDMKPGRHYRLLQGSNTETHDNREGEWCRAGTVIRVVDVSTRIRCVPIGNQLGEHFLLDQWIGVKEVSPVIRFEDIDQ